MQSTVFSLVHLHSDLLAAREQVVLVEGVDVLEVVLRLRAGQELHAPALEVGRRSATHAVIDVVLAQAPIERVLMPGHEARGCSPP